MRNQSKRCTGAVPKDTKREKSDVQSLPMSCTAPPQAGSSERLVSMYASSRSQTSFKRPPDGLVVPLCDGGAFLGVFRGGRIDGRPSLKLASEDALLAQVLDQGEHRRLNGSAREGEERLHATDGPPASLRC